MPLISLCRHQRNSLVKVSKKKIGPYSALQAEIIGTLKTQPIKLYYKIAILETPTHYYKIAVWTSATRKGTHEKNMEKIIDSFRQVK